MFWNSVAFSIDIAICDDNTFNGRTRPCILYQIKRCSGPCVGYIEKDEYKKSVDDAIHFVSGKSREIQKSLSKQMEAASENLDFEKAGQGGPPTRPSISS